MESLDQTAMQVSKGSNFFAGLWRVLSHKTAGIFIVLFLIVLAFVAGIQYGQKKTFAQEGALPGFSPTVSSDIRNRNVPASLNGKVDFAQFWEVWDLVSNTYFDKSKVDPQKMMYGAISGMVSALGDPYTNFLPPTENKLAKDDLGGNFEGVGIELGYKDNRLVVIAPLSGTPAERAGIIAGDYIVKIEGKETDGLTLPEAVNKIRGQKGTHVKLQLYRSGTDAPYDVDLVRESIHVTSVTFTKKDNGVGYIKLSKFGDETNDEWDKAVSQALQAQSKAIVLDVRNNPGGYLQSAIYIGSEFMNGPIVKQEKSDGTKQTFNADRKGKLLNVPVVVLINKGSASASEILAGALLANNRGTLVGETSFGKGTIQEVQELENGSGIHITRARWLMPNDYWVHEKGINPNVEVKLSTDDIKAGKDPQLDKAIEIAKKLVQ